MGRALEENITFVVDKLYNLCYTKYVSKKESENRTMTETKVEIRVLEPHKAEGIKELCYEAINNPDTSFTFLGSPNITLGQRREELLNIRQQAQKAMTDLEKESEDVLNGKGPKDEKTGMPLVDKSVILSKLNSIMDVVSLIDKYSIENTKAICRKSPDTMAFMIGHANVSFPISFDGDEVVVNCAYYEDISLDEKLLAEYTELDDTEKEIEFLKKHVEFGNISLTKVEDVRTLENFKPGDVPPAVVPLFANIDPVYTIEVDK